MPLIFTVRYKLSILFYIVDMYIGKWLIWRVCQAGFTEVLYLIEYI